MLVVTDLRSSVSVFVSKLLKWLLAKISCDMCVVKVCIIKIVVVDRC